MAQFLQIGGRTAHVSHRPGSGRPVVFANSLGTDLRIWDGVVERLPAHIPLLRIDKRGHGLSEGGSPVTIAELAVDLAAAMDAVGLSGAVVCGVSVGGMIAQSLAAARPELAASLLLSNTGLTIGTPDAWAERAGAVRSGGMEAIADGMMARWFSAGFLQERATEVTGYHTMLSRQSPEGYAALCAAIGAADLTADAPRVTQPALCIGGTDDVATPPALLKALAAALPQGEYREIARVGHLPCIEVPGRIADAVVGLGAGG